MFSANDFILAFTTGTFVSSSVKVAYAAPFNSTSAPESCELELFDDV